MRLGTESFLARDTKIRLLKMHGLKRKEYADVGEVINFIIHQLEGSGRLHGYRWMYKKCLKNGIRAKKEDVRLILAVGSTQAVGSTSRT